MGNYVVSINKSGFNPIRFESVALEVGQSRTLDAPLSVGAVATALKITASTTPLDQTNAQNWHSDR